MELSLLEKVKRLAAIAMFSDDTLMEKFVLKGGNAIDLIYRLSERASIDLDFSIHSDFKKNELQDIHSRIGKVLEETFLTENLVVFDIKFYEVPKIRIQELGDFWGGYRLEFKIIQRDLYVTHLSDIDFLRRNAGVVGPNQKKTYKIDISKFEYCEGKRECELDGYTVFVYTPEMIVFEKIRALCQQTREYKKIIKSQTLTGRARDFFDIYILCEKFNIDPNNHQNKSLLKKIFEIKKVPLSLMKKIRDYKEFHRQDFSSVENTVKPHVSLKEFDFYFDYVVDKFEKAEL